MTRTTYDIAIIQGETWSLPLRVLGDDGNLLDLSSGYLARFQARKTFAAEAPFLDFADMGDIDFTDGSGSANLILSLTATETAALPAPIRGPYELEIQNPIGTVEKILRGTLTVLPEVVR